MRQVLEDETGVTGKLEDDTRVTGKLEDETGVKVS